MIDYIDDQALGNWPGYMFQPWYRHEYITN